MDVKKRINKLIRIVGSVLLLCIGVTGNSNFSTQGELSAQAGAKALQYTLSYDVNGVVSQRPQPEQVEAGQRATEPDTPRSSEHVFLAWNTKKDGSGESWDFLVNVMPERNVVLYAQWRDETIEVKTVVFDLNGGQGVAPEEIVVPVSGLISEPSRPIRPGFDFWGWNVTVEGREANWDFNFDRVGNEDITLYAQWRVAEYVLSYSSNGISSSVPNMEWLRFLEKATEPVEPTNENYTFIGWNTTMDGQGKQWNFAVDTMPENDVLLYAQWRVNTYIVTYDLNGIDASGPAARSVEFNSKWDRPEDPIKTGQRFLGWNTQKFGDGKTWNFVNDVMPGTNMILYAQWEQIVYDLSYDLNGGEGVGPITQKWGENTLIAAPVAPRRSGYTFIAWNTAQDGSGSSWNFATNVMPAQNLILYAQWEQIV
ncbi:MAG: InlB B-repeat-containing protein, partial [Culicoidibacterales bacterium]